METKKPIKSKIIWINIIPLILEILHLFDVNTLTAIGVPAEMQAKVIAGLALFTSMLTIFFRFGTSKALKSVLLLLVFSAGLPSCSFIRDVQNHGNVKITKVPTHPNDAISITASFWGTADLIHQYAPGNTKVGKFLKESTKHCKVELVSVPKDANDTISIRLTCDSTLHTVQGWIPKK